MESYDRQRRSASDANSRALAIASAFETWTMTYSRRTADTYFQGSSPTSSENPPGRAVVERVASRMAVAHLARRARSAYPPRTGARSRPARWMLRKG